MNPEKLIGKWFKYVGETDDWFKNGKWYKCVNNYKESFALLDDANELNGNAPYNHKYFDLNNPQDKPKPC